MPIPQNPVFVPPELKKLLQPPPQSGLPFNAQLHPDDLARGYRVPNPYPRPPPPPCSYLDPTNTSQPPGDYRLDLQLKAMQEIYEEFTGVLSRATVKVIVPTDQQLLDRIHKTIEFVMREGPVFESIIIAREKENSDYKFMHDFQSQEHVYYRWKLYSLLHGDDLYLWKTDEFKMFEGGPTWQPPPLNPYADGMPEDLIRDVVASQNFDVIDGIPTTIATKDSTTATISKPKPNSFIENKLAHLIFNDSRPKGSLGKVKRETLGDILRNLNPTKQSVGAAMMFCINHSDAAKEVIECIHDSLQLLETPYQKKVTRLYLVSDVLNNSCANVTNASYYREGFKLRLVSIFEHLREYLINMEDKYKADKFKQQVLSVLGAWKEWTLYEDEFVLRLSNILLGISTLR